MNDPSSAAPSAPASAGDVLERDWARLHPLSPVVQFGRGLGVVVVFALPRLAGGRDGTGTVIDLVLLGLGLVVGFVHWLVTRWRVVDGELQIETGLIRRQSIRVPLRRLRAVDVVRPALGRVFGLAEVRVDVAGAGSGRGRLAYLPNARATAVRAQLLALAHGLPDETPTPVGAPVWTVDNARLVASALLSVPSLVLLVLVAAAVAVGVSGGPPGLLGGIVPLAIAFGTLLGRRVLSEYGFAIDAAGDGLRLHSGLVQTRAQTIPSGRVQAVRCTQGLLWRPLGWYRLEVDVARQRSGRRSSESDSEAVSRALMPVGSRAEVAMLLELVLPAARWEPVPDAAQRSAGQRCAGQRSAARPPRRAVLAAPLSYPALAAWFDDRYAAARTGRLRRSTVLVPLDKIQSVRWVQGPLGRLLHLATVHVDVAGRGWGVAARRRDEVEAQHAWQELAARARLARMS